MDKPHEKGDEFHGIDLAFIEEVPVDPRLYRARVVLGFLNTNVWDLTRTQISWESPVPITDEAGIRLGFASLWVTDLGGPVNPSPVVNKALMADLTFDYQSEARLLAEQGEVWAYPIAHPCGAGLLAPIMDFTARPQPAFMLVTGIMLRQAPHGDCRILPVGKPVL